ncbi:PadR family transcriptional regulator [Amycolatopsis magusensis]|uniref:DNA-binding PadR family transcriptional regulator n=1 Tax=Amycolatopsis magusensis TaxID=882444 RepID=A0ABS4PKZ9_9PSEU|nr:PadR family transcriptional regulator [Amycolatopsis magusensis]MBP2179291.1 DNA-binding PadR family transcriptional regulator [Amycolatopsis magusensis]
MRARRTPLNLAVLSLLNEQPRHPYELQSLIKERHIADVVRMRGGSLYDAIARLVTLGFIEVSGTTRDGARPERTVYAITDEGRTELFASLREYVGERAEEYPVFSAGLAHIGQLSRAEAEELLRRRESSLAELTETWANGLRDALASGLPRAVLLEVEYAQAMRRAELAWLRKVLEDMPEMDWTGGCA